jgi:hypothetical protein
MNGQGATSTKVVRPYAGAGALVAGAFGGLVLWWARLLPRAGIFPQR